MPFLDETPVKSGFLDDPNSGFLGEGREPDAARLKEIIFAPGSTFIPEPYESAKIFAENQAKPVTQKVGEGLGSFVAAIPEVVGHIGKNIGIGAWQAYDAYANQGRAATEAATGLGLTGVEGLLRGGLDLGEMFTRGAVRGLDYLSRPFNDADPAAQYHARLLRNLEWDRMRQQMAEGQQGGWIDPTKSLQDNGMLYPGLAEATSNVADPSILAPGGALAKIGIKGATTAATKAAQHAIERAAGEGLVSTAARGVESAAGRVADAAIAPGQKVKEVVDTALPNTGLGSTVAATPAAMGASVAIPARGVQQGAKVVEQLGRTSGDLSVGRLGQIAMSESAPAWIRGAAHSLERAGLDDAAKQLADATKSAATGAAVGAAISYPGAESAEDVGMAAGSGFALGGLTHLAMSPAISGRKYRLAQDTDIIRWHESKPLEEQAAISAMNLDRDAALKLMTAEVVANGFLDPNANVRFVYQDPKTFEAIYGTQRGVAIVQGEKPTIIFNTGKMKTGTAYHELFHTLSRSPDIVDYGALTTKLLGVHDEAGNVIKPGLLSTTDLAKIGDQYFSRLDAVGQKSISDEKAAFDANPSSPQAAPWVKRMINEIGAELFSNLARDTKGSLLDAVDKPTLRLVDSMTRSDRAQWVQKWGAKLQEVLGAAPNVESDIFPGLKSSPELQAMMRDFIRAKRDLTKTPEFGDEHADPTVVVNPRDALRTGGDEIIKKFPDNDNFAKDATGQPMYSGGRPVLLTEGEIKKVQTKRAEAMTEALAKTPDTGEAGVMRPSQTTPAVVPPGAVPSPKAAKPTGFVGRWFSDAQMTALNALPDNVLTPSMKAKLKSLNDLVRKGDGSPILLFYNAALKNRRYSSAIRETARVLTPISMSVTKDGNFTVTGLDITAFNSKLNRWMNDKPKAFADFTGADDFVAKTQQYLDNHQKGQPGATGLDADPAKAQRMAYRINDFVNIQDVASAARNPDRLSNTSDKDSLIRSFRFDRMNRIEPASGDKFPINYELQKQVFSPDSDNFKAWFGDSKVVDAEGKPIQVYHGTARLDRVGNQFRKSRANSGPMQYFTDNAEIASSYSKNKPDTTVEDDGGPQLFVGDKPIDRAWYSLTPEQQAQIARDLPRVAENGFREGNPDGTFTLADTGNYVGKSHWDQVVRQKRGNWLAAAKDVFLDSGMFFGDEDRAANILKFVGLDARVEDPTQAKGGVVPVYLSIKNPLDTAAIPPQVVEALEKASRRARSGRRVGVDAWDKHSTTPQNWMEGLRNDLKDGTTYSWTSIPDWVTRTLTELGYDGIKDKGGKYNPDQHGVWVPFEPTQIKSPFNRGTWDPTKKNILHSPDAPETTPIGVESEKKYVDNQVNPDNIVSTMKAMFSPDEVQFKRVRPLPHSVGETDVPVVHFSSQPGLKKLDPAYMGKGMANSRDRRGGPKSFFFVAESPLGADEQFFGQGGKVAYGAVVSGTRLYDLRLGKPDPLGYNNALNPAAAEETLASKGYAGVLVEGGKADPRKTVVLFKRTAVKELPVKGPMKKAPRVEFSPDVKGTPSEEIRGQAAEYNAKAGIKAEPHQTAVPVREDLAKRLADAFEAAKHEPENPEVKKAYDALATETKAQWDYITGKGVKMEPWAQDGQPYKNSAEMIADVRDNKHLWFFPTDQGYGQDKSVATHPMLTPTGVKVNGKELVVNDLFRAVHDYFGHAKESFEFGPKGEYNAYLAHNQMFSDSAKPALASETLAQNSWVNYGKHLRRSDGTLPVKGDKDFVPVTERPYADQKATLLPQDLVAEANNIAAKKAVDKVAPMMSPDNVSLVLKDLSPAKLEGDGWAKDENSNQIIGFVKGVPVVSVEPVVSHAGFLSGANPSDFSYFSVKKLTPTGEVYRHLTDFKKFSEVTRFATKNFDIPKQLAFQKPAQPTQGPKRIAGLMSPDVTEKSAKRALSILAADGNGVTLNLATGRNMAKRKAYAVSIFPERSMILEKTPTKADLEKYIEQNQDLLGQPENALGIWHDKQGNKFYVDVSVAVEDPAFAKYLGKKFNQKAIWDFQKAAEIPTGGDGKPVEAPAPPADRISLAREEFKSLAGGDDLFGAEREKFVQDKVRDLSMIQDQPEGQTLSKLERAAVELGKKTLRERVQLIPGTDAKVRARRALQQGVPEVIEYLAKAKSENFDAGNDWYRNDISKMEETTREIFPETKSREKMALFKALLASLSGGQTPKDNYRVASEAFAAYLETGKFSHESLWRMSEDGQAKQLGRNAKTAAEKFEFYREHFKGDEKALADYLLNIQPKLLIADPKSNKVQAENNYGAYDLGPKFGAFFLNLNGLSSAVTVDIWATRTWNRWMGTPLRRVDDGSKRGRYELPDAPTESERPVIQDAFKQIAEEVSAKLGEKVDPMDVQAVLWFYEKDLFSKLGVRVDRGSFSKSAEDYKANPIHKMEKGALRPERGQLRMELQ